jgi:hypothetical protein
VNQSFGPIIIRTLLFIVFVTAPLVTQQGDSAAVNQNRSVWRLDLKSSDLGAEGNLFLSPVSIDFVDSETLVIAWFNSQQPPSPGAVAPAMLEAVYLDAKTGKQKAKSEWQASSRPINVEITASGNLLVRTGETIRLFSPAFKELQEKEFPTAKVGRFTISSGGRKILVCPASEDGSQAQLLDVDTFQVLDTF